VGLALKPGQHQGRSKILGDSQKLPFQLIEALCTYQWLAGNLMGLGYLRAFDYICLVDLISLTVFLLTRLL
jgi:hypothetical protein